MDSPIPVRRVSSSSQTSYNGKDIKRRDWNNDKDRKIEGKNEEEGKRIQITSFNVPFGKISLSKKVKIIEKGRRKNTHNREIYYFGVAKKRESNSKCKWSNWAYEAFEKLPLIGKKNNTQSSKSGEIATKIKKKINLSEDYGLFEEPLPKQNFKQSNYSMHKTFYEVLEDLSKRKHQVKSNYDYYF